MEKRWTIIFKALGNVNRIKVIKMLSASNQMSVTEISEKLGISLKSTSRHLSILQNLDILESEGRDGFVFYYISKKVPVDLRRAITLFS